MMNRRTPNTRTPKYLPTHSNVSAQVSLPLDRLEEAFRCPVVEPVFQRCCQLLVIRLHDPGRGLDGSTDRLP